MRGPKPPIVALSADEHRELTKLAQRHTTSQQLAVRARIILTAASGLNNSQIARSLALDPDTVRLWRTRWLALHSTSLVDLTVVERLTDAPRAGRPADISAEQVCQIIALACESPTNADNADPNTNRPISQWSGREVADEVIKRGIVPTISPRHAARLLKRGLSNHTSSATGSPLPLMRSLTAK
jgi:putative transposase